MKKVRTTALVAPVLMVMCLTCVVQPASAGVEAECRQEADDYGVMPELVDDYITGCIDSRGGMDISAGVEDYYVPSSEPDETNNLEGDSGDSLQ